MTSPYKKLGEQPPTYPQEMQRALSPPAISVQQTRRGWCQECFGCEAKSEYKVYAGHLEEGQARDENIPQLGHLLEESPCILRCCCLPTLETYAADGSLVGSAAYLCS